MSAAASQPPIFSTSGKKWTSQDATRYNSALRGVAMSTFVPATNTIRVAVEYNQSGHLSVNVYHVLSPHAIVSADLTSIAAVFASWIGSTLIPLVTASWSAYNINARDLTTSSGIILDTPLTSSNTGTHSGSPAPNSTALVTSWRTGRAGRYEHPFGVRSH